MPLYQIPINRCIYLSDTLRGLLVLKFVPFLQVAWRVTVFIILFTIHWLLLMSVTFGYLHWIYISLSLKLILYYFGYSVHSFFIPTSEKKHLSFVARCTSVFEAYIHFNLLPHSYIRIELSLVLRLLIIHSDM